MQKEFAEEIAETAKNMHSLDKMTVPSFFALFEYDGTVILPKEYPFFSCIRDFLCEFVLHVQTFLEP